METPWLLFPWGGNMEEKDREQTWRGKRKTDSRSHARTWKKKITSLFGRGATPKCRVH